MASTSKVMEKIQLWKQRLIDLSRRNRLIYFSPSRSSYVEVAAPDPRAIFERLVVRGRGWEVWQPPEGGKDDDNGPERPGKNQLVLKMDDPRDIDRILRSLSRRSASEYRERGVRILYMTFGMLNWREAESGEAVRSPLLLVPIELRRDTPRSPYRIEVPPVEEEVVLNPALALKLRYDYRFELPPLPDFEEVDLLSYLREVSDACGGLGWRVEVEAGFGLFSFYKLVMYQDLSENAEEIARNPIISALAGIPNPSLIKDPLPREEELDEILEPKRMFQVLDADSSQQLCIQYALRGQSFVIHGPPGTGKSQTIANIISEFIAAGRSVLFVSEKMAALEVVYNRLKERGLDDFCLELHSQKANKREVVAELNRALNEHLKPRARLSEEELERLKERRDLLNSYVKALHVERPPLGLSAFELLGRLARLEDTPFIPSGYPRLKSLTSQKLRELEKLIADLSNVWKIVLDEGSPWRGCREESFTSETRSRWATLLDQILEAVEELERVRDYSEMLGLRIPRTLREFEELEEISILVSRSPRPPRAWLEAGGLRELEEEAKKRLKEYAEYWSSRERLEKLYSQGIFRLPRGTADEVERRWAGVKELLSPKTRDIELARLREELIPYSEALPRWVEDWRSLAEKIAGILSLGVKFDSIERIRRVAELIEICEAEKRPEAEWLDPQSLREATETIGEARGLYLRRDGLRGELLGRYREEFLSLEPEPIIMWLEGPGSSPFRYFRPQYHRLRRLLSGLSREETPMGRILEDLKAVNELRFLEGEIASRRESLRRIMKSYYRDPTPDFESAEEALKNAWKVLRIAGGGRIPPGVASNLTVGSRPSEELLLLGRRLNAGLGEWRRRTLRLRDLLPYGKLPNTGKPLLRSDLQGVAEWSSELFRRLSILNEACAPALSCRTSDYPTSLKELISDLREAEALRGFEESVEAGSDGLKAAFGRRYMGIKTDWPTILEDIDWCKRLLSILREPPKPLIAYVSDGGLPIPRDPEIGRKLERLYGLLKGLEEGFSQPLWEGEWRLLTLEEIRGRVSELRSRLDELQSWIDFKRIEADLEGEGLGGFLRRLIELRPDGGRLLDIFHKSIYSGLIDLIFEEEPILRNFRGERHEQLIREFQELDRRFVALSASRVIERANEQKPQGVYLQAPDSEIAILRREALKKSRHMPIRELFERIPTLLKRLKPCLLMSPISVSQFLSPKLRFDLVIFDEASQICTEDAVGSIYRGNQLIVAGDNRQLPPTPFFQYSLDEEFDWDEGADYGFDVFESVLDECLSIGLPVNMLRWHYRSRHDSLINFSNERFYDNKLNLFPHPGRRDPSLGVKFVYVPDGVYDRGGARNNPREAEVVADLVFEHFKNSPDKTLGVITFNISQMNTIQDAIERRLRDHPEYQRFFVEDRLQGFFVKNLENVMGDERDVIIFSVGYGYDHEGRMTLNFGPLNKPGGERRLNVAITRAREKVIIVSSIKASDIDIGSTKAPGVHHLHSYLLYAERLAETHPQAEEGVGEPSTPIEMDILSELEGMGYEAVVGVGPSTFKVDIGVKDPEDPDRFILGILLDGENYRSAYTARDRDRLRQQILEGLGWRIHRIWSPDWVQRRETEVKRLKVALERALQRRGRAPPHDPVKVPKTPPPRRSVQVKVVEASGLPGVEVYRPARLKIRRMKGMRATHAGDITKRYRERVRELLPILVEGEGPIHIEHAYSRINSALGVKGAPGELKEAFLMEVRGCHRRGSITIRGDFLWARWPMEVKVRVPAEGLKNSFRPMRFIPQEELRAALTLLASHSIGVGREALIREAARLFGFKKLTRIIREEFDRILEDLIREGTLAILDGYITVNR